MRFHNAFIPYRASWSSPFCKWQGALSGEHPMKLVASVAIEILQDLSLPVGSLNGLHFGMTVPQHQSFWGAPWIAAMMGASDITGPTISQACATSARLMASAAGAVSLGHGTCILALAADRISNGPHLYYPDPHGPGGMGVSENWVWDNFNNDPYAKVAMVQTAENIAKKFGFSREEQDDLTLHRYEQYQNALAYNRAFQKGYMRAVSLRRGVVEADEGIAQTNLEKLQKLKPVIDGGTVTFGGQTHPADGHAGALVVGRDVLSELAADAPYAVEIISYGEARVEKAYMGMAPVPAAKRALQAADLTLADIAAVKTHNPFVVNDLYFAHATGFDALKMNNFGSSLIFGHPQGPTGLRLVIELIEELGERGGGYGLMTGCAAGDTGAALVVQVSEVATRLSV